MHFAGLTANSRLAVAVCGNTAVYMVTCVSQHNHKKFLNKRRRGSESQDLLLKTSSVSQVVE